MSGQQGEATTRDEQVSRSWAATSGDDAANINQPESLPPQTTIGGSTVGKVLGVSKWGDQWDAMRKLLGLDAMLGIKRPESTYRMRRGIELEPVIADAIDAEAMTGIEGAHIGKLWGDGALYHKEFPFLHASIDRVVMHNGKPVGATEIKTYDNSFQPFDWSRLDYWLQLAQGAYVLGNIQRSHPTAHLIVMQATEGEFTAVRRLLSLGMLSQDACNGLVHSFNVKAKTPGEAMEWINARGGPSERWVAQVQGLLANPHTGKESHFTDDEIRRSGLEFLFTYYNSHIAPRLVQFWKRHIVPFRSADNETIPASDWPGGCFPASTGSRANLLTIAQYEGGMVVRPREEPLTEDDRLRPGRNSNGGMSNEQKRRAADRKRVAELLRQREQKTARRKRYKADADSMSSDLKAIDAELHKIAATYQSMTVAGKVVTRRKRAGRQSFDSTAFREAHPALFGEFVTHGDDSWTLSVKKEKSK